MLALYMAGRLKLEELITRRYADRRGAAGVRRPAGREERPRCDRLLGMAERILVVDDQRTNAEMVSGLLRNLGYEVDVALDGEAALELVRSKGTDLVISDILMPRMDGYELVRRLRANPATTLLPVILVTSGRPADRARQGHRGRRRRFHRQAGQLGGAVRAA